jgi:hypothetical protein
MTFAKRVEQVKPHLAKLGFTVVHSEDVKRAEKCYKRNLKNPGDCEGDDALLFGLAIGESLIGQRAGWIPEVQRIGCSIADYMSLNGVA